MSKKKQQSIINKLSKIRIPDLLFHYTTSAGLTGIIETGKIWLTKIQYTNDKNELCLALEQIRTEIDLQGQGIEKTRREEELDAMGKALHEAPTVNVGVASFTKEGDQLSQWRGYCEIGKGYSLGFDGKKLKEVVCKQAGYHLNLAGMEEAKRERRNIRTKDKDS